MASECFCGCGLKVPFGRKRAANAIGRQYDSDIALFRGAVERHEDPEHETALAGLAARGQPLRDMLRDIVHGTADRKQFDKAASRAWLSEASDHRLRLAKAAADDGYVGWNSLEHSELINTGKHASAVVVDIEDTGMTVVAAASPDRVDQLAELRASGALTDEEFEAEKARILAAG